MIRATKAQEEKEPLGVEYVRADVGALERLGDFDLVIGIHLLHYASSREHLNGMCQSISRNLKPAGRFIGYQSNYDIASKPHYYDKYLLQRQDFRAARRRTAVCIFGHIG